MPAGKSGVVKLHVPLLLTVVVPRAVAPPSDSVTVEPAGAVPDKVTVGSVLGFTTAVSMTGAAGGDNVTVTSNGFDAALVPAEVVSVAVNA